ncbi:hypothetical protein BDW74DRAFT_179389 [Aspergillus multicolor]|uniref:uncharacterized protein n=1 Tax=Aspergillus multicolor TaxID=41759 RepID=UPI003CCE1C79
MSPTSNPTKITRRRAPKRTTTADSDSSDHYDWDQEETHIVQTPMALMKTTRTPSPGSSEEKPDYTDPANNPLLQPGKNPYLDSELLKDPLPPSHIAVLEKMMQDAKDDPIEMLLDQYHKNMETMNMINILREAETVLFEGNPDAAEEKIKEGMELAIALENKEGLDRCQELMECVETLRAWQEQSQVWGLEAKEGLENEDEEEGKGKEVVPSDESPELSRSSSRMSSEAPGGETLGDLEGGMFDEDGGWVDEEEGSVKIRPSAEKSDKEPFNPHQLQSPAPEEENEEKGLQRYESRSPSTNSQGFVYYQDESKPDNSSAWETESVTSITSNQSISRTITRKRLNSALEPSTSLFYTHNYRINRKPYLPDQRLTYSRTRPTTWTIPDQKINYGPTRPTAWIDPDVNADLADDNEFHNVFWHPHSKTMLLREPVSDWEENWDMAWLDKYSYSSFSLQQDKFTFRCEPSMKFMASRVRKTNIFPRQEWEYLPSDKNWNEFKAGTSPGEKITFEFLEWERERMQDLLDAEKGGLMAQARKEQMEKDAPAEVAKDTTVPGERPENPSPDVKRNRRRNTYTSLDGTADYDYDYDSDESRDTDAPDRQRRRLDPDASDSDDESSNMSLIEMAVAHGRRKHLAQMRAEAEQKAEDKKNAFSSAIAGRVKAATTDEEIEAITSDPVLLDRAQQLVLFCRLIARDYDMGTLDIDLDACDPEDEDEEEEEEEDGDGDGEEVSGLARILLDSMVEDIQHQIYRESIKSWVRFSIKVLGGAVGVPLLGWGLLVGGLRVFWPVYEMYFHVI